MIIEEMTVNERVYCAKDFALYSYDFVLTYGTKPLRSYSYGLFTHNVFSLYPLLPPLWNVFFIVT